MIELIKPDKSYYILYKEMMDEWHKEGGKIAPWPLSLDYEDEEKFDETLKYIEEIETNAPEGFSTSSTYWVYDRKNDKILLFKCSLPKKYNNIYIYTILITSTMADIQIYGNSH